MRTADEVLQQEMLTILPGATLEKSLYRPWASATFAGARHFMAFRLEGDFPNGLSKRLDAHEFTVPGHIVADICLVEHSSDISGWLVEIEALTVEAV